MTERTLVGNAADPKQIKRARQHEKHAIERERLDLATVLGSAQGRRFVWKQLCDAGVFRLSFTPGVDPHTAAFYEGRRAGGLELMVAINAFDPRLYHQMAKEAHDLEQAYGPTTEELNRPDNKETDDAD